VPTHVAPSPPHLRCTRTSRRHIALHVPHADAALLRGKAAERWLLPAMSAAPVMMSC
jgi:hypothetical protein